MRERVELIKGNLHIESRPGKGTTVEVIVPNSVEMVKEGS
jgi:signal transduction histidine kinase